MGCTSPLYAWKTYQKTKSGKDLYFVTRHPGKPHIMEVNKRLSLELLHPILPSDPGVEDLHLVDMVQVPCGKCEQCRLDRAKEWSERIMIESLAYEDNYFVTLTFHQVKPGQEVSKKDVQAFVKRLRTYIGPGIRFFACGEYGEKFGRPHYHLVLFNCPLDDLKLKYIDKDGHNFYTSATIEKAWKKGFCLVGDVSPETAMYVARYTLKKTPGKEGFILMSRNPGIGCDYYKGNVAKILPTWKVYANYSESKKEARPPRYFEKVCEKLEIDLTAQKALNLEAAERAYINDMARYHYPNDEARNAANRSKAKARVRIIKRKDANL